jgi:hypothetical protein
VDQNSSEHSAVQETGAINLAQGEHIIRVRYFNSQFNSVLNLFWTPPGGHLEIVPSDALRIICTRWRFKLFLT